MAYIVCLIRMARGWTQGCYGKDGGGAVSIEFRAVLGRVVMVVRYYVNAASMRRSPNDAVA